MRAARHHNVSTSAEIHRISAQDCCNTLVAAEGGAGESEWKVERDSEEALTLASQDAMTFHTCISGACECVGLESTLATMRLQHSHDFTGACFSSVCFLQQAWVEEVATCCGA